MKQSSILRGRQPLLILLAVAFVLIGSANGCYIDEAAVAAAPSPSPAASIETAAGEPSAEPADGAGLFVAFLDIGQGDCIFLRSPSGSTMLVDAGPEGVFGTISRFLDAQGVIGLDVVVASHLHTDHIGSMTEIVDSYPIGTFYYPPFDVENNAYFGLLDALEENRVSVSSPTTTATSVIPWDDAVTVRILSPYDVVYSDYNDTSYILSVTYGDTSVLLTGDAGELAEKLALKALPNHYFQADVLKVGHHGSLTSTSEKFLSAVGPSIAVISAGAGNEYGLPEQDILDRLDAHGVTIYRTDLDGTVCLLLDGTNVRVLE